jgi:hypothetical protein
MSSGEENGKCLYAVSVPTVSVAVGSVNRIELEVCKLLALF